MNAMTLRILTLLFLGVALGHGGARALLSSNFIAKGEKCLLEIRVEGQEPDVMPIVPQVDGVQIEALGPGRYNSLPGRRIESSYRYVVSSYSAGVHVIPAVDVLVDGVKQMTEPLELHVFDPSELTWSQAGSEQLGAVADFNYAATIRIPERKFYENQTFEAEIKLYVPRTFRDAVNDWGVPEFERDGLAVWRFEPSDTTGEINLLGGEYISRTYRTTVTALRDGKVSLGPATVRLIYVAVIQDGYTRRLQLQTTLDVGSLELDISPLPAGAPPGFVNAVGDFTIGTAITETDVVEGEPLALDIVVNGRGNLDNLTPPVITDEEGWKVYDTSAEQRGEERRNLSGTVVFNQFIRPLEMKSAIPPFKLVFFDPDKEVYKTVTTSPIPLKMTPAAGGNNFESSGPPQALPLPIERMTDILGLIDTKKLTDSTGRGLPGWLLHALGGAIALALIGRALWMRYGYVFEKDQTKVAKRREFNMVENSASNSGLDFLKTAGGFVEKWLLPADNKEIMDILEERDRLCFQPMKSEEAVPRNRRQEILRSLRKAAFSWVLLGLLGAGVSESRAEEAGAAAKEAYQSAKFEDAAALWLDAAPYEELSADTLYNIGNAAYRMGSPGDAALYYRRALLKQSDHGEALQNLRFIERKYGSVTVSRQAYQYVLAKLPLSGWKTILWSGAWLLVIGLLVFPATRPGSRLRVAGVIGFILGPLMISFGAMGSFYFPDDAEFASLEKQAVVVGTAVVLHTDAARTSPQVIDAPPGSLIEVIKRSGRWAYVGFATKTRGWVEDSDIEMVLPEGKPEPPKAKKAEADGSSA
ncbi:MAG: hypothetical protein NWT08_07665 [Akkermansiaceae bacterium]|jgi:tetratricopeptide (TPR) repeat protein|nr:hypothetical protein [Akkermansiaceae bacterium]MDP4647199.1 hypothetical protein [Akkermansiaceae bacterium]MDP4845747.1 hypothetical protein [Akkermansiaceae bacterium]